jgi:hypothetical protein
MTRFTPLNTSRAQIQYWLRHQGARQRQDPRLAHAFAQPTAQDVHLDAALSSISIMHTNAMYIGDRVFANVPVDKQSDKYYVYPKGAWFRNRAGIRAPSTASRRAGYVLSTDSYYCDEWAVHTGVSDEMRRNADAALTPDQTATEFVTDGILLAKEIKVAALCMTAANWTSSEDVAGLWAAGAGNTFIVDMHAAIELIRERTGRRPNVLIVDASTYAQIQQEATVLDRIKYTERGIITADLLASMFKLEEVLVGDALENTADETVAGTEFAGKDIWETNANKGSAFLFYRNPSPGLRTPSAGYTFTWLPRGVRRWYENMSHEDIIEAFENYDVKVTSADLGHVFYDTHTT